MYCRCHYSNSTC